MPRMGSRRDEEREGLPSPLGTAEGKELRMQGEMREESATAKTLTKSSPKQLAIKMLGSLLGFADLRV